MAADQSNHLTREEFTGAFVAVLGYSGPAHVVDEIFGAIDNDDSGKIGFDELYEFIRGRRHSLDLRNKRVRDLTIQPPKGAGYTLEDVVWDEHSLRALLQQARARSRRRARASSHGRRKHTQAMGRLDGPAPSLDLSPSHIPSHP